MAANIKLQKNNILKTLKEKITVKRGGLGSDYSSYIFCEFSHLRLTHDEFDNHYYHSPTPNLLYNGYGIAEEAFKSRSR